MKYIILLAAIGVAQCDAQGDKGPTRGDQGPPLDSDDFRRGAEIDTTVPEGLTITEAGEGGSAFEGDIQLTELQRAIMEGGTDEEKDEVRSATKNEHHKWPKVGDIIEVPYTITNDFDQEERALIARGFDDYHKNTCIRMVPRSNQNDYISVFKGDPGACWSYIGKVGGENRLSLGKGCPGVGVVVHELMHALGYWHEQSRPDRDNYIQIHWDQIKSGKEHNFDKCKSSQCDTQGIAYDTTSVMQYATWAFSKGNKPTMTKIGCPNTIQTTKACQLGQYDGLAATDIEGLNKLYQCGTVVKPTCKDNVDYAESCGYWAGLGYCKHSYVPFMLENCKKSCGCPAVGDLKNAGLDCWAGCNGRQGRCDWCGRDGYCCRKGWHDKSNGCDGNIGIEGKGHSCVLKDN